MQPELLREAVNVAKVEGGSSTVPVPRTADHNEHVPTCDACLPGPMGARIDQSTLLIQTSCWLLLR